MSNPLSISTVGGSGAGGTVAGKAAGKTQEPSGDFASAFREPLDAANRMQGAADANVQALLTGESQSVTDVLAATRKAQVAFSMLMEIRNKLVDAYQELQNMRV